MGRRPYDRIIKNVRIVNVFTEEIIPGNIGIVDGMIACKPSFSRHAFPIAGNCLGKELAVLMPKGESLSLLVTEKYRQFYMIKVEEG